jgi:hypothetical protein
VEVGGFGCKSVCGVGDIDRPVIEAGGLECQSRGLVTRNTIVRVRKRIRFKKPIGGSEGGLGCGSVGGSEDGIGRAYLQVDGWM